jgi:hypothetical protein
VHVLILLISDFIEAAIRKDVFTRCFLWRILRLSFSYYELIHFRTILCSFSSLIASSFNILLTLFVLFYSISYANLISISFLRVCNVSLGFIEDPLDFPPTSSLIGLSFSFPTFSLFLYVLLIISLWSLIFSFYLLIYPSFFYSCRHWITFFSPINRLILFLK